MNTALAHPNYFFRNERMHQFFKIFPVNTDVIINKGNVFTADRLAALTSRNTWSTGRFR
jgi:hypothetical protein